MIFWLAASAWAGPWVRPAGSWYAKAGLSHFRGEPSDEDLEFRGLSAGLYAEVGLLDGLEAVVDLPYSWGHNRFVDSELRYRAAGPGTARLGFTATHPGWQVPASLRLLARLPLSGPSGRLPLDPSPGEQQLDLDAWLALGASPAVGARRMWGLAELGLRTRTPLVLHDAPETLVGTGQAALYHAQLGWLPSWGWLQAEGQGFVDLGGPRHAHTLGVGAALSLGRGLHLEAGVASTPWGDEARGWGYSAGISHLKR